MAISIRDMTRTLDNKGDFGSRQVFNLSNGHVVSVVRDFNGSGDWRIYVYETSDRVTWTLRATITPWTTDPLKVTCAIGPDDDLHILCLENPRQTLKYCRVDYADWSVGGWQTVDALVGDNEFRDLDIDVADDGSLYVGAIYWKGDSSPYGFYLYGKVSGTWSVLGSHDLHSGTWSQGCESVSIVSSGTQTISAVVHNIVFLAVGYSQNAVDQGVHVYRTAVKPSDGSLHPALADAGVAAYAKGEGNPTSTIAEGRLVRLFRHPSSTGSVLLGIMHSEVNRRMFAVRLNTTVGQVTTGVSPAIFVNPAKPSEIGARYMGMTVGSSTLEFLYGVSITKFPVRTVMSFSAHLEDDDNFLFANRNAWFLKNGFITNQSVTFIASGGQKNSRSSRVDIGIQTARNDADRHFYHEFIQLNDFEAPVLQAPANGSTTTSSNPQVIGRLKYGKRYMQTGMTLSFELATDSAFTDIIGTFLGNTFFVLDDVDLATGVTGLSGLIVPSSSTITPGTTVYMRARSVDDVGNFGPYSATSSFTVAHPPTASNLKPVDGAVVQASDSDSVTFSWTFNDTSATDTQGAYQVQVFDDTDTVIADTGKVSTNAKFAVVNLAGHVGENLTWQVKLWDNWDTPGVFSVPQAFLLADPPTVSITSPTPGEDVGTPISHVEIEVTTSGGGTIKSYRVVVTQGRTTVYDTGNVSRPNDPSGSTYQVDSPGQVLHNLGQYTVTAYAIDNRGFQGRSDPVTFSASWTPPDMPTTVPVIDLTHFNVEGEGYIVVTWDDSGKDADFVFYVLQRKDDLVDTVSGDVLAEGTWNDVATIYDNDTAYEYHDYLAPATNYKASYRVVQAATIFNDVVLSEGGPAASAFPESDQYWLIDPELAGSMMIHNVTGDSYTEEYETESYHVIGRGNHVDYGDRLGYNGSVTAQLRNTAGTSARSKKIALEQIRANRRSLYFRTPFGDVKLVSVGDVQVSRIAGVGIDEFCDLTIPYLEVGV